MSFTVINKGFSAAIQDLGRPGYQRFGVIVGGVMDAPSAKLANWLVGNNRGAAVIEFSFLGPAVRFEQETLFAITGALCQPRLDERAIGCGRPVVAHPGQILQVGGVSSGSRGYIAFAGGMDTPPWLGSRSTYERAGQGGWHGRSLREQDSVPVGRLTDFQQRLLHKLAASTTDCNWFASLRRAYKRPAVIRVMRDVHWPLFTEKSRTAFLETDYQVTRASDRMGYRLEGMSIQLQQKRDIYSEAVAFGSIQVPPNGQPIILMADHQSTGGYPRIAHVAAVDLPLLGQLPPGSRMHFRELAVDQAERLLLEQMEELDGLQKYVRKKLTLLIE